ncbi:AraC family transcriptional regulator [Lactobacillus johnsonii]|uniref:AraC family transcriptional regulator n=1 Tax=Lactobacillus johnsonii TaxID=33959 RepID=UPI000BA45614|nr:AraC family transcriptional regulator [Lactobacillus johnsonii]PAB40868.1 transcriptional regulator [Lactobacillus johnsonii]
MIGHEEVQNNQRLPFYFYYDNQAMQPEHWHQGIELNYLIKGKDLRFALEGQTYHLNSGDIWLVNRRQIHSASGETGEWKYEGLIIDDDFLLSQYPSSINWNLNLLGQKSTKKQRAYNELVKEIVALGRLCRKPLTDARRFIVLSHLMKIIVLLDQNFNNKEQIVQSPNLALGDEIIKYINEHFQEDIQVGDIAQKFNISHVTLNRQLKQTNNLSMGKYLKLVRLMHARELLLNTNKSIELVAYESGFSNTRVLNRNFKSWKYKTPTEYRNEFSKYFSKKQ